jgi:hypothetical protein
MRVEEVGREQSTSRIESARFDGKLRVYFDRHASLDGVYLFGQVDKIFRDDINKCLRRPIDLG